MLAALTLDCKLVNRTPIFNTEQEVCLLESPPPSLLQLGCILGSAMPCIAPLSKLGALHTIKSYFGLFWSLYIFSSMFKSPLLIKTSVFGCVRGQRFLQRFEILFKVLAPEPMSYFQFKEATCHNHFSVLFHFPSSFQSFFVLPMGLNRVTGHTRLCLTRASVMVYWLRLYL